MDINRASLEIIQQSPMKVGQWYVVLICIGILALEGYDVLSIAFAAPGIAGYLFMTGLTLDSVAIIIALGSFMSGFLLLLFPNKNSSELLS